MQKINHASFDDKARPAQGGAVAALATSDTPGDDAHFSHPGGKILAFSRAKTEVDPLHLMEAVTIRAPSDIADAANLMARIVSDHRMRMMVSQNISSQQRMVDADGVDLNDAVFGWHADADADADANAPRQAHWPTSRCPIVRACRVEGEPFWVNRAGFRTAVRNPLLDHIDPREMDQWSTCKAAIVIPIHLPFGEIAVARLVSNDPAKSDQSYELARFGGLFTDLSRRFVSSYVTTMRDNPYLPHEAVLSVREVDCLRWAAFGKTDKEVGIILGTSHATVRYHLSRICTKLDATNRTQAIFRAGQLGYLGAQA